MSVVRGLRIVLKDERLPISGWQLPPRQVHIEGLWGVGGKGAVETRVLPPSECMNYVLLEGIPVQGAGAVRRVWA
ncbi:hypothetical protein RRF57_006165 [Xylaria bambusicola]|uniref:Uncharacterized protein n=1 Tax=Xylaria bambusicola TaxID=326684 RepID=A0AAN7UDV3_9PEZI